MLGQGIRWIASYPKSGSTYVRMLLEAERNNGSLDINNLTLVHGDTGAPLIQGVSPTPIADLGFRGEALLRPAALLGLYCRLTPPVYIKTHWCNLELERCSPGIPADFTEKALYIVRDPRDVFHSFSRFYGYHPEQAIEKMSKHEFGIGGQENYNRTWVSSWTNHVAGWIGETHFPVHVVRYEDLLDNPAKELKEILEFFDKEADEARIKRAVAACQLSKVVKQEKENGFREYVGKDQCFFGEGGSRWREEVAPKYVRQIEKDHGPVMKELGYAVE